MGSEASNKMSQEAARGNGENTGAGPEEFPMGSKFENAGSPGNVFGDKKPRTPETTGASLAMGLSYQASFEDETPDELGEGRDVSTGKPDGPEMGKVDNGGASAKVEWG